MKVGLRLVMVTQKWPNNLYRIQRTSVQEERLLRLGEPDTVEENLIPEMVIEPEEGRLETQRNEVPEAAVMVDKWRSVIRSAMELRITLKAMASAIQGSERSLKSKCGKKEFEQTIDVYKRAGWIDEDKLTAEEEALAEGAQQMFKKSCIVWDSWQLNSDCGKTEMDRLRAKVLRKIGGTGWARVKPRLVQKSTQVYKKNFKQSLQGAMDGGF